MRKTLKYAFRITHIDNIQNITTYGLVRKDSPLRNKDFTSIGDQQIIQLREDMDIKGLRIGSYIPFYLGPRSPMLYVIQHGYNGVQQVDPEKIVYCVVKLEDILNSNINCIFTDGHVLSRLSNIYPKDDLKHISDIINYDDVYSKQWNSELDLDLKRRKEAELLIIDDLPIGLVCGFVVYNDTAKQTLMNLGTDEKRLSYDRTITFNQTDRTHHDTLCKRQLTGEQSRGSGEYCKHSRHYGQRYRLAIP